MEEFRIRLKRLRLERNLWQEQAAEALGVSASTYRRWERGTRMPGHEMLAHICAYFGVSRAWILGEEEAWVVQRPARGRLYRLVSEDPAGYTRECLEKMARLSPERRELVLRFIEDARHSDIMNLSYSPDTAVVEISTRQE